jgi:hypothetical protein
MMAVAHILFLSMWVALSIWNMVYVNEVHTHNQVYLGAGSPNEDENGNLDDSQFYFTKKGFVLANFCWMLIMATLFFYFYCVALNYSKTIRSTKKEKEMAS